MKNKTNIHKVEKLGFFIAMWIVSCIVGMAIVCGIFKLVFLINN